MGRYFVIIICAYMLGCGNRTIGPAEDILHEGYIEGELTRWAYDVREKSLEEQRRIKASLLDDATRILDAYLLIGCTNQTQFSRNSEKVMTLIHDFSREFN